MTAHRPEEHVQGLVRELCKLPRETEWVEFKHGKLDPEEVGEYLSALANAAALASKPQGYVVWGVRDDDHALVGTKVDPASKRVGNELLESWLSKLLTPRIDFRFHEVEVAGKRIVVLEVPRATTQPVRFKTTEFIRIGSCKRRLRDFPEKERSLWRVFDRVPFECGVATERQSDDDVLRRLDYPVYFDLLERSLPDGRANVLEALEGDRLIARCDAGGWNITNLGALLFAKDMTTFPGLARKALRVVVYKGAGRLVTERERVEPRGYACGFEALIEHVLALLPTNEVIQQALRRTVPMYPELAVREVIANALIHQDFAATGTGPMVEVFEGRVEVTNPGEPLVAADRFLDSPPASRNEGLASLMRRFRICEERGSGIDRVVAETEFYQLPAPLFEVPSDFMRVALFAHRPPYDARAPRNMMKYVPSWAAARN